MSNAREEITEWTESDIRQEKFDESIALVGSKAKQRLRTKEINKNAKLFGMKLSDPPRGVYA